MLFLCREKLYVNVNISLFEEIFRFFMCFSAKCKYLSQEILCKLTLRNCLHMLLHSVDSIHLSFKQVRKMSAAFNTVVRRIFPMSRFSSKQLIYVMSSEQKYLAAYKINA